MSYMSCVRIIWNCQICQIIGIEVKRFARLKNWWSNDTTVKKEMQVGYFCYWWVCCIANCIDDKEFAEINDSLRRIIVLGWVELQTFTLSWRYSPETSIRCYLYNYPARVGLETQRWEFQDGVSKHKDDSIIHKEIGQGYISTNDVLMVGDLHGWFFLGTRKKTYAFEE